MAKSQISTEFIFAIGVILLLFIVVTFIVFDKKIELRETEEFLDKRNECLKFANYVNSVYTGGHGTEVTTKTNYVLTFFNNSLIAVEDLENVTFINNKFAVLASEAGPTSQEFYDEVNNVLDPDPDWYKVCFTGIGGAALCDYDADEVNEVDFNLIDWTLDDLIKNISEDSNAYTTIYLEDPTIYYGARYPGNNELYTDILRSWVLDGNALILSEHIMCRERPLTTYISNPQTDWRCHTPDGTVDDIWNIFDINIHQLGSSEWSEVIQEDVAFNLNVGDRFRFEEESWIEELAGTENFVEIATYEGSGSPGNPLGEPAIAYWDIDAGRVFYFGDFQILDGDLTQTGYSNVIVTLIKQAYLILNPVKESDITCKTIAKSNYYQITGRIKIKNVDGIIQVYNATAT